MLFRSNYLSVLSAENQVFTAQALLAELQSRRLTVSTDLIRALGGGYSPVGTAPKVSKVAARQASSG